MNESLSAFLKLAIYTVILIITDKVSMNTYMEDCAMLLIVKLPVGLC